jgi:hypothetical protein
MPLHVYNCALDVKTLLAIMKELKQLIGYIFLQWYLTNNSLEQTINVGPTSYDIDV